MAEFKCTKCGDTVDGRGRRGHARFSGGPHGDRMELPDEWSEWFEPIDGEDDPADEDEQEGDQQAPSDAGGDTDDQSPTEREKSDSGRLSASQRIRLALTDDVTHLWRND